jgi:ribokinase
MPGRVLVVGSVNIDLVVSVDHLPRPGETVIGGRFARHHGGKGANQAVAAARLGASTAFIGAVGDDAFGPEAQAALDTEGVDTTELLAVPGTPTGVALIVVDAAGENSIAVAGGANAALTVDDVRAGLARLVPTRGDVVLVGLEIPADVARAALEAGRTAGATTILNPAPATDLDPSMVDAVDILTPNEGELAALDAAGIIAPTTLVSLGAAGARLTTPIGQATLPALDVETVDTVGAGDALNGALAAAIAEGRSLADAARWAVAAASLAVTRRGAREGMPTRAELESAAGAVLRGP